MADGELGNKLSDALSPTPAAVPIFSDRDSNSPLEKFLEAPPQAELEAILGFPLDEDRLKIFLEQEKAQRAQDAEGSLEEKLGSCFLDVHKALASKKEPAASNPEAIQALESSQALSAEASQALPTEALQALPAEASQALPPEAWQAFPPEAMQAVCHEDSQIYQDHGGDDVPDGLPGLGEERRAEKVKEGPTSTPAKMKPPPIVISPDSAETLPEFLAIVSYLGQPSGKVN